MGVIRNHYVGRTFIQPSQSMRDFAVKVKLNPVKELLKDRRVVIIEDSIIRGTTAKTRIKTLRTIGAREIHLLVSCPPHRFPCFYGIDFSTRGELIAARKSVEEIRDYIGLDSLGYLSMDNLVKATHIPKKIFVSPALTGTILFPSMRPSANSVSKSNPEIVIAYSLHFCSLPSCVLKIPYWELPER